MCAGQCAAPQSRAGVSFLRLEWQFAWPERDPVKSMTEPAVRASFCIPKHHLIPEESNYQERGFFQFLSTLAVCSTFVISICF